VGNLQIRFADHANTSKSQKTDYNLAADDTSVGIVDETIWRLEYRHYISEQCSQSCRDISAEAQKILDRPISEQNCKK
jgi:hypothetical protein